MTAFPYKNLISGYDALMQAINGCSLQDSEDDDEPYEDTEIDSQDQSGISYGSDSIYGSYADIEDLFDDDVN